MFLFCIFVCAIILMLVGIVAVLTKNVEIGSIQFRADTVFITKKIEITHTGDSIWKPFCKLSGWDSQPEHG